MLTVSAAAQPVLRTLVGEGPVIVGEPFQVQYVLENIGDRDEFLQPEFKFLQYVSGPNIYIGSVTTNGVTRNIRNMMYTLVAVKPGRFIVPGAAIKSKGQLLRSENAFVQAISREEAIKKGLAADAPQQNDEYYLRPGEDPYKKISKNLFIKVQVDRKACYVGQPVTATFKLYSRLQSRSDIFKNPGFYGFAVQDMVNLNDRQLTREVVNGKKFFVHTVRKVQLYPLRPGTFTIDPMEIQNQVQFSRNAVGRKTEQEIVEGLFSEDPMFGFDDDVVNYTTNMKTDSITIDVKAPPVANKPEDFNGATGHFKVDAELVKSEIARNEEGELRIKVSGKGNLTQLVAPSISWPAGIEGFDPEVSDSLDHSVSPMQGTRTFKFKFISGKSGNYTLPSIDFSFFDPDTNRYKSVATNSFPVVVNNQQNESKISLVQDKTKTHGKGINWAYIVIALGAILVLITGAVVFLRKKKKPAAPVVMAPLRASVNEILHPVSLLSNEEPRLFYNALRKSIWNFFEVYFNLSGSGMNKFQLQAAMEAKHIDRDQQQSVFTLLDICEAGIFTTVESAADQPNLLEQTRSALEQIRNKVA